MVACYTKEEHFLTIEFSYENKRFDIFLACIIVICFYWQFFINLAKKCKKHLTIKFHILGILRRPQILRNLHLTFDWHYINKSEVKISQNFVAFSEYMNFNGLVQVHINRQLEHCNLDLVLTKVSDKNRSGYAALIFSYLLK